MLTEKQLAIITQIRDGHSNGSIARTLQMPQRRLKRQLTELYRSLSARNRTHAVVQAIARRLIGLWFAPIRRPGRRTPYSVGQTPYFSDDAPSSSCVS